MDIEKNNQHNSQHSNKIGHHAIPKQSQSSASLPSRNRSSGSTHSHNRSIISNQKRSPDSSRKFSNQSNQKARLRTLLPLIIVCILVIVLLCFLGSRKPPSKDIADGISYLEALEAKDPDAIDEMLAAIRRKKMETERDAILEKLRENENDVWAVFHDFVILGDSRAVGFYYYDFLEKNRVLADGGNTIRNIEPHLDEIKALKPSYIFLCYGLNDVSIGFWSNPEEYAEEYMEICAMLKKEVPSAKIIISSTLPARDPAFERSSLWRNIPDFNDVLSEACSNNDIVFVDNSQICEEHADLWDIDGIHVRREFYSYWARNLIVTVIEDELYEE